VKRSLEGERSPLVTTWQAIAKPCEVILAGICPVFVGFLKEKPNLWSK